MNFPSQTIEISKEGNIIAASTSRWMAAFTYIDNAKAVFKCCVPVCPPALSSPRAPPLRRAFNGNTSRYNYTDDEDLKNDTLRLL